MNTITIYNNNNIQFTKNNNNILLTNSGNYILNPITNNNDLYDLSKINKVVNNTDTEISIINDIKSQLGDLSVITHNKSLASIVGDALTQLTHLKLPTAPINSITSSAIKFNDINFNIKYITGYISWDIPIDLTNITHFEGYLSKDKYGLQRELTSLFVVNNTVNKYNLTDIFIDLNSYIVIYTKNINDIGFNSIQTTEPGYVLINDLYCVNILSASFIPDYSLYNVIKGTLNWIYNIEPINQLSMYDGVNIYFSSNGITKDELLEENIAKNRTNTTIINKPYDDKKPYYVQFYT